MVSRVVGILCALFFLVSISTSVMAMGRRVKPAGPPPSLGVNQPEVELIKPEELPPTPPISEELKETKPQEVSALLDPDEATKNRQIQTALKNAGYDSGAIDGKIGAKTKKAIKDFQTANGLKSDGKVGLKTWAKLGGYLLQGK